jgi:hypothetical protein
MATKLNISFSNKKAQETAKKHGFIFNTNLKLWVSKNNEEIEISKNSCLFNLIVENTNSSTTYGTGCITTHAKALKFGYDAIEN